ncbi:MAG: anti sigma factor C-terminal domain-containing protein [Clostridia bacterium]|nr:anti sigma factor C-terminal domain-containing protein [Clostridia bacterium]
MNRKIRSIAVITVTGILLIAVCIRFVLLPLMNRYDNNSNYNPALKVSDNINRLDIDMTAFTELEFPGYAHAQALCESLGYGNYSITLNQYDAFRDAGVNYDAKIEHGKLKYLSEDFYKTPPFGILRDGLVFDSTDNGKTTAAGSNTSGDKEYINELKALPETSDAKVYVSFKNDIPMSQVMAMTEKYSTITFLWFAVRCRDDDPLLLPQFGFALSDECVLDNEVDKKKYPDFSLTGENPLSTAMLEAHFKSIVQYLYDQDKFINLIDSPADGQNSNTRLGLSQALGYIKKNGVKSYGCIVMGSCSDILNLRKDNTVNNILIDDVKLSSYSH